MAKTIKIGGRLESVETGNIVAGANQIIDDDKNKRQSVINGEVDAELVRLDETKQGNLTFDNAPTEDSNNPVKSGGVYAADKLLSDAIEAILLLIPSAASALNKLVDMQTMNSSIATATATFRGTYNVVSDLELAYNATHEQIAAKLDEVITTADNNDYAFVQIPVSATSQDIAKTERYKFNGEAWAYEYDLNNSGFTQAQWDAINSTITAALVSKLSALPTATDLQTALNGKQDNLTFDLMPTSGSQNPVTSGGVYTRNAEIAALITALDTAKQDKLTFDSTPTQNSSNPVTSNGVYVAVSALQAAIVALDAEKQNVLTFDSTPTLGSNNPVTSSGIKTQLNRIDGDIVTLNNLYQALTQSALVIVAPTDTWPVASPDEYTIYRVVDRVNTPPQYYSDYMWNGTSMVEMAQYNNAIDDELNAGSSNLLENRAVFVGIYNKSGHLSETLLGSDFPIYAEITVVNGYFNLSEKTYHSGQNYSAIIDVSRLKGKHLTATTNGTISQYAFFIDYNSEKCVLASEKVTGSFVNNTLVPENANYLYVYLGSSYGSVVKPVFVIDEGASFGEVSRRIQDTNRALIYQTHGVIMFSDKQWNFYNTNKNKYIHIIILVYPNDNVEITRGSGNYIIGGYLKDYIYPSNISGLSYDSNHKAVLDCNDLLCNTPRINQNTDYVGTAPSDAKYLYLTINYDSTNDYLLPSKVSVGGHDVFIGMNAEAAIKELQKVPKTYCFSNMEMYAKVKEIYIEGQDIDLSGISKIRIYVAQNSGSTYYDGVSLIDSNDQVILGASKDFSSLDLANAFVENGFLDFSTFYENSLGATRIVIAGDLENLGNRYYAGTFQNNISMNLSLNPSIEAYINSNILKNVGIKKESSISFHLLKYMDGKLLKYHWTKNHWQSTYNNITVIDEDCWSNDSITKDGSSAEIAQCNINFIHMYATTPDGTAAPELHVGNGHGCTVDKVFDIFIDGAKIDLSSMANGETLWGHDIYIIQQADGYYPDRQRTIDNNGGVLNGDKVYAKVNSSGEPIKGVRWCLDYHFTYDNEKYINRLFILNDNTSFRHCYGAMNCILPSAGTNHVSANDNEMTLNSYVRENNAWTVTAENGVNLSLLESEQLHNATKVVQYGDDFRLETECINDINPTFGRIRPWFAGNTGGGRVKMYHTPINVTDAEGSTQADVFNAGDVISCHVIRNVSIK